MTLAKVGGEYRQTVTFPRIWAYEAHFWQQVFVLSDDILNIAYCTVRVI
jgi:hypothetical protein